MIKFRPQSFNKIYKLKNKFCSEYNFTDFYAINDWKLRTFSRLHYLGSHSPITEKWKHIEYNFFNRYKKHL